MVNKESVQLVLKQFLIKIHVKEFYDKKLLMIPRNLLLATRVPWCPPPPPPPTGDVFSFGTFLGRFSFININIFFPGQNLA